MQIGEIYRRQDCNILVLNTPSDETDESLCALVLRLGMMSIDRISWNFTNPVLIKAKEIKGYEFLDHIPIDNSLDGMHYGEFINPYLPDILFRDYPQLSRYVTFQPQHKPFLEIVS